MNRRIRSGLLLVLLLLSQFALAQKKMIALTIDDLPFVGDYRNFHLNMMMKSMQAEEVSATGFIIASEVRPNSWNLLHQLREAGFGLGNHTFSHANLNQMNAKEYMRQIKQADLF